MITSYISTLDSPQDTYLPAAIHPLKIGVVWSFESCYLKEILHQIVEHGNFELTQLIITSEISDEELQNTCSHLGIQTMMITEDIYNTDTLLADEIMIAQFKHAQVDYVVFAGYKQSVGLSLRAVYENKVLYALPSLLPEAQANVIEGTTQVQSGCIYGSSVYKLSKLSSTICAQSAYIMCDSDTASIHHERHKQTARLLAQYINSLAAENISNNSEE